MALCKGPDCTNEANREYCSPACRARAWRERHIIRCPHGTALPVRLIIADQEVELSPRVKRSEPSEPQEED